MSVAREQIERCVDVARQFGVQRLILFGSAAESPDTARDIDLACEGVEGWRFFELGARLEEETRADVDLIPLDADDEFSQYILDTGRVLYEHQPGTP
jgi:uncharacterized protein